MIEYVSIYMNCTNKKHRGVTFMREKNSKSFLFIFILLFSLILIGEDSLAYNKYTGNLEEVNDYDDYANKLKELGVFNGTNSGFELDRQSTRVEAAVMLVRLLGAEEEAIKEIRSHPFTDVPNWANAYVGYLYSNGITNGESESSFGSNNNIEANTYFTFILRALGYSDKNGDFMWGHAIKFTLENEMISDTDYTEFSSGLFYRKKLAKCSYIALKTTLKDSEKLLAEKLVENNYINREIAESVGVLDRYIKKNIGLKSTVMIGEFTVYPSYSLFVNSAESVKANFIDSVDCSARYILKVKEDTIFYMTVSSIYINDGKFYHIDFYSININGRNKKLLNVIEGRIIGEIVQDKNKIYLSMITSKEGEDAYYTKWEATSLYSINYDGTELTKICGPIQLSTNNIKRGNMIYTETNAGGNNPLIRSLCAINLDTKKIQQIKFDNVKNTHFLLGATEKDVYYSVLENGKAKIYRTDKDFKNGKVIDTLEGSVSSTGTYIGEDAIAYAKIVSSGKNAYVEKLVVKKENSTKEYIMPISGHIHVIGRVDDKIFVSVFLPRTTTKYVGFIDLNKNKLIEIFRLDKEYRSSDSYIIADNYIYYSAPKDGEDMVWRYNIKTNVSEPVNNYNSMPTQVVNFYQ